MKANKQAKEVNKKYKKKEDWSNLSENIKKKEAYSISFNLNK